MNIAIIGAGAAGLMAAARIREQSPETEVILIERNSEIGRKVLISGGGRCNLTTGLNDVRAVLANYPRGSKFLNSALRRFPPIEVRDWFQSAGVPLKVEADGRVFPVSDKGSDIISVFERLFDNSKVRLILNFTVKAVTRLSGHFVIQGKNGPSIKADKLIITTGGRAYRETGSQGDGYTFAESLGHRITPLAASLNSFIARESWPKKVAGLSFERAELTARLSRAYHFKGPIIFTHQGLSGPAVFAFSSLVAFECYEPARPMALSIDLFPNESQEQLGNKIKVASQKNAKKSISNLLDFFLPKSLIEIVLKETGIVAEQNAGDFSAQSVRCLVAWLKAVPLTITRRGRGDEFVTAGGVRLEEVNQRTMESKIVRGLYFAGEILDMDGFTGGFNLQSAWATGALAGESALNNM